MPAPSELLSLWYAALAQPLGIKLHTPDAARLKPLLYTARNQSADPALSALQIRRVPPPNFLTELWIINPNGLRPEEPSDSEGQD